MREFMKIEIYSKPSCGYCVRAKMLAESKGLEYIEINVMAGTPDENDAARTALIDRVAAAGAEARTMPQIFVDDAYVGGFDQFNALLAA